MPIRMLRDWTNSDRINALSPHAEVFFIRLIMKADDFGCYWADTKRLKGNLFILRIDKVRDADISRWLAECQKAGLIVVYEIDSKKYLQIIEFNQRKRQMNSQFPPPTIDGQLTDIRPPEEEREREREIEVEEEREGERNRAFAPPTKDDLIDFFINEKKLDDFTAMGESDKFLNYYGSNGWKVGKNKMKNWKLAAAGWFSRMNDFKKEKNGSHQQTPKPGTSQARIEALRKW